MHDACTLVAYGTDLQLHDLDGFGEDEPNWGKTTDACRFVLRKGDCFTRCGRGLSFLCEDCLDDALATPNKPGLQEFSSE
jgi:hypothetical protein